MPGVLSCRPPLLYTRQGISLNLKLAALAHLAGQRAPRNLPVYFSVLVLHEHWPCLYVFSFYFILMWGFYFILDWRSGPHFCASRTVTH